MILSIESSCDDSSIAITEILTLKLLFYKKISQNEEHSKYGGVVPELASRLHVEALPKLLQDAEKYFKNLKAIAVTNAPGLTVSLLEGVAMAKSISIALNIPLIAVNHLKGHIYSLFIEKEATFPFLALLISGGHSQLVEVNGWNNFKVVLSTLDDSLGESFDKVAKMLGLSYPGGAIIENLAINGDEYKYNFPVPLLYSNQTAFSFSGLKNSVRLTIEKEIEINDEVRQNISASFQRVATEHIILQIKRYLNLKENKNRYKFLGVVGGVSANLYIRNKLLDLLNKYKMDLIAPELKFCSDNGAMIGRFGIELYRTNEFINLQDLKVMSRANL